MWLDLSDTALMGASSVARLENGMPGGSVQTGNPSLRAAALSALLALASTVAAAADPVADFYRGKTITLIIGSGEGGGYDINGRLTAGYLSQHIPGPPTIH